MGRRHRLAPDAHADGHVPYLQLVRANADFRRLWLGNVVSLLGDWFNTIAIYYLIDTLTGSPFALGAVFVTKMLPWALASPIAGVIVDRFERRRIMIVSDLIRAAIVLGFLVVDTPERVYLIYVLTALQVMVGSVFQPAQSASLPNITTHAELLTANALMAASWSLMLALGAAAGGFVTEWLGVDAVFVLDSISYLVSAWFVFRTRIPQETEATQESVFRTGIAKIMDGWRHLRTNLPAGRIALAKATWAIGGGGLVFMLALMGEDITPGAQALGIGLLFSARGIGTGIGPIVARALFRDQTKWPFIVGASVVFSGAFYVAVGLLPWTLFILVLVAIAHAASGANWVLATMMLQTRTPDQFRGRVFATEWLLVMIADAASILVASMLLETGLVDMRAAVLLFAAIQILSGLLWIGLIVPHERSR